MIEVFCSNHSAGFTGISLSKLNELFSLNECSLLHVIYTSIKWVKEKELQMIFVTMRTIDLHRDGKIALILFREKLTSFYII